MALELDYGPLWRQSAFAFESRRHGTRTGLRPSLAPVRLCLRIAANPNLDSPPACCGEILLERLPSNSARPFSPAAGFLFVKARGNSHQSVAVPVKSPVSHLHAIKQWHCDHRSSAKPPKGCKIDEVRRPLFMEAFSQRPCFRCLLWPLG